MQKIFYVYKITCLCDEWNGKFYIGSTGSINPEKDKYTGRGKLIKEYFKLYPKIKNVTYKKEIIECNDDPFYNKDREEIYLQLEKNNPDCININFATGYGTIGVNHTDVTRKKLSELKKNKKLSLEHRIHISEGSKGRQSGMLGKSHSPETKEKIAAASRLLWEQRREILKNKD